MFRSRGCTDTNVLLPGGLSQKINETGVVGGHLNYQLLRILPKAVAQFQRKVGGGGGFPRHPPMLT